MDFIYDEELKNLKLMLRLKDDEKSVYYVFEKEFQRKKGESLRPYIVGDIFVWHNLKTISFSVNDNCWDHGEYPNYQLKGYGTSLLHYVENSLLPSLEDKDKWIIKIAHDEDNFKRFKAHVMQKETAQINKSK